MPNRRLLLLLVAGLALAGCSEMRRGGAWPTLAPRAGELSPMVPRTPVGGGACAACGPDAAPPVSAAAVLPAAPADVTTRLAAIASAIAAIEAEAPAQQKAVAAARASAAARPADTDAASEAEVQRSRFESLLLPLALSSRALDTIEDDLAGKADAEASLTQATTLRARIAALAALRDE